MTHHIIECMARELDPGAFKPVRLISLDDLCTKAPEAFLAVDAATARAKKLAAMMADIDIVTLKEMCVDLGLEWDPLEADKVLRAWQAAVQRICDE